MKTGKEKVFNCGHSAKFTPRNDNAFVETDDQIIIESPCSKCRRKNKVVVKINRIQRWKERRQAKRDAEIAEKAKHPIIKKVAPPELNRLQRRKVLRQKRGM